MTSSQATQEQDVLSRPRFLDAGEAALVVEFGERIDPEINDRVLALDAALTAEPNPAIRELVPTYRSLMIHYNPLKIEREELVALVQSRLSAPGLDAASQGHWVVPCCYEDDCGEDVGQIAQGLGLSTDRVVTLHASATYRIYMYGFSPGFSYLGGLPSELAISRRPKPRPPHAAGGVLIAGGQACISTFSMPTGWYVIGRTPERLYAPERSDPFFLRVGETLRFDPVDFETFRALEQRAAVGEILARRTGP